MTLSESWFPLLSNESNNMLCLSLRSAMMIQWRHSPARKTCKCSVHIRWHGLDALGRHMDGFLLCPPPWESYRLKAFFLSQRRSPGGERWQCILGSVRRRMLWESGRGCSLWSSIAQGRLYEVCVAEWINLILKDVLFRWRKNSSLCGNLPLLLKGNPVKCWGSPYAF